MGGDRDIRLLTGAVSLSALGDWLAHVPLALNLEETTGSGIAFAALFIAVWSPVVALAGPSGLLGPRWTLLLAGSLPALAGFAGGTPVAAGKTFRSETPWQARWSPTLVTFVSRGKQESRGPAHRQPALSGTAGKG
jgi:hypothetical protein